jgi:D-glycero-D-manno-heptose 1,7-bisphosphate phosphatase
MRAGADDEARDQAGRQPSRPAVFLDRDGTLVEEVPYLHDPDRVVLLGGVPALGRLAGAGYALVVVTNQAGVARGLYDEAAVEAVHRRLAELLAAAGVRLDAVLHCPHHPAGTVPGYARACRCRKPGPGMLEAAAERLGLDLAASWLIGNHPADMGAAVAAGVRPLFVTTGRAAGRPPPPGVAVTGDLEAAVRAVLGAAGAPPAGMQKVRPAPAVTERA